MWKITDDGQKTTDSISSLGQGQGKLKDFKHQCKLEIQWASHKETKRIPSTSNMKLNI